MANRKSRQEADGKEVPVMKFSNDVEKMTNPGIKTVYRFYKKDTGKMITARYKDLAKNFRKRQMKSVPEN